MSRNVSAILFTIVLLFFGCSKGGNSIVKVDLENSTQFGDLIDSVCKEFEDSMIDPNMDSCKVLIDLRNILKERIQDQYLSKLNSELLIYLTVNSRDQTYRISDDQCIPIFGKVPLHVENAFSKSFACMSPKYWDEYRKGGSKSNFRKVYFFRDFALFAEYWY